MLIERKRMKELKKDVDRKKENERTKERCTQIDRKRLIEYTKDVYRKKEKYVDRKKERE